MKRRQLLTISALLSGLLATVILLYLVCKLTAPTGRRASPSQAAPTRTRPPTVEVGKSRDGDVRYVAPDCGEVPAPCYTSIQEAVDAAHEGDVIKVAASTYTGVSVRPRRDYTTTGVVTQVVYLDKSVTIQGGYTITNWTTPDPDANSTTLDALGRGRAIYVAGRASPTIEGLHITGGDAAGQGGFTDPASGNTGNAGGGVYVLTATATLRNNHVFGNAAGRGGGVFAASNAITFTGNTVFSNSAEYKGGGVYLLGGDDALLDRNTIFSNAADKRGGGVFLAYSAATLRHNTVSTNNAYVGGGLSLVGSPATLEGNVVRANAAGWGGGLSLSYDSDAVLSDNIITANAAREYIGGLYLSRSDATLDGNTISTNAGSGLYIEWGRPTLRNNIITANSEGGLSLYEVDGISLSHNEISYNTATRGGGIDFVSSVAMLDGDSILANIASEEGGGVAMLHSNVTLANTVIADNQAGTIGSGVYVGASSSCLLHTTVACNAGGDGSGIHIGNWSHSVVTLTNTILVSHTVGITVPANSTATLSTTLWGSGEWANASDWSGGGTIITGSINVWGDPAFVDPDRGNYHITAGSAALDAGVTTEVRVDLDGDARPIGDAPDLGADEWAPSDSGGAGQVGNPPCGLCPNWNHACRQHGDSSPRKKRTTGEDASRPLAKGG